MQLSPSEYGGFLPPPAQAPNGNRVAMRWRVATAIVGAVLLIGYLMLAVVFGDSTNLQINQTATTVVALFLIALSYATSAAIVFIHRHRKIFLLRSLFIPYLILNLIALFNVLLNIFARNLRPLSALRVIAIGLPAAFILLYGCAAFLIYCEYGSTRGHRAEDGTPLLNEEEMQRRQLSRLLEERSSSRPSPKHSTYRLEIPMLEPVQQKSWDRNTSPQSPSGGSSQAKSHSVSSLGQSMY